MPLMIQTIAYTVMLLLASNAYALKSLQTNITGGIYDPVTQTIIGGTTGTLNLYGVTATGDGAAIDLTDLYYVSIAVIPQGTPLDNAFGSFVFNGTTYSAANSNMVFGFPPLEEALLQGMDANDLPDHSIFETAFAEESLSFSGAPTTAGVNTPDTPGWDPTANPGTDLFYRQFAYDATGLADGFQLHFDLYNTIIKDCANTVGCTSADIDIENGPDNFAPFSHDSETSLAEPGTLGLMMIGMMGVGASRIRRRRPGK